MTAFFMMKETLIALLPAAAMGVILFGSRGLWPIVVSTLAAISAEVIMIGFRRKKLKAADIGSAALTGLLLALTLPPAIPWYATASGAMLSIIIAKHFLGGLGYNIFNPALVGRAFLMASWPVLMTTWVAPFSKVDAITTATPLAAVRLGQMAPTYMNMLFGLHGGSIGETCAIALLLGGLYLLIRKIIEWRIPLSFIGTVMVVSALFGRDPIFQVLGGGLMLGAFFMATDPVTSPVTKSGRWAFGIGCGIITMVIRLFGGYPEGVCYAILIMNAVAPLMDRYLRERVFGA